MGVEAQKPKNNNRILLYPLFFAINFIEGGIVLFTFLQSPSMTKNVLALGFSKERLFVGTFLFILVTAFLYLSISSYFEKSLRDKLLSNTKRFTSKNTNLLLFLTFSISLIILNSVIILFFPLTPQYSLSSTWVLIYERVKPLLIWMIIYILQSHWLLISLFPSEYSKPFQEIHLSLLTLSKKKYFHVSIITLFLFPLALLYGKYIYSTGDDTHIYLIYARNFLQGNGLTYNGMRVEGFTSTLWVTILIIFGAFGFPLLQLIETMSFLSGLLALFSTYHLSKTIGMGKNWALLPCLLLVATGDFTFYISVGLEQILFTAFLALCVAKTFTGKPKVVARSNSFVILNVLMIFTRPEGVLIFAVLIFYLVGKSKSIKTAIGPIAKVTILLFPIQLAKRLYYGYWLPNTFYAKSNAGLQNIPQGLKYLQETFPRYSFVIFTLLIIFCLLLLTKKIHKLKPTFLIPIIIFVWVLYVIINGGDNNIGGRMIVPILPLFYVLLIYHFLNIIKLRFVLPATILISLILFWGYIEDENVIYPILDGRQGSEIQMRAGLYLKENYPPDTLVALNAAGIIPYYSEMPTIDMLGLNNEYIAHYGKFDKNLPYGHQRGDGEYVLSQSPDFIIFRRRLNPEPTGFISDQEIWNSDIFKTNYHIIEFPDIGEVFGKISEP